MEDKKGVSVEPQGRRNWAVYLGDYLVEGGFFSRDAAEACAEEYRRAQDGSVKPA